MNGWTTKIRSRFFRLPKAAVRPRTYAVSPQVEGLEIRLTPAFTAIGAGPNGQPTVTIIDGSGTVVHSFLAYDANFTGGVNVALGDVNGDGIDDIVTGSGSGGAPHVKVFDGQTFAEIGSFYAFDASFTGGVSVATSEINGDGATDIIAGAGSGGGPHVKVFDGRTGAELQSFFAYDPSFTGGVKVAAGDLNGDLLPDIITGTAVGGGPNVKVFDGRTGEELESFFAYDESFRGGVEVGSGDIDGNGTVELITGTGPGGGPHVRVWTAGPNATMIGEFLAGNENDRGGVRVGSMPGFDGNPDAIAVAFQGSAGPIQLYDLAGESLGTNGATTTPGVSVSSPAPMADLLLRYHTLSQIAPNGGAGRLESLGGTRYRLTVAGVNAATRVQWFDDAPGLGTGQDTLEDFVRRIWPRQYGAQGVNTVLESLVGDELIGNVYHLVNPTLDLSAGTLSFEAVQLDSIAGEPRSFDIDRLILGFSPNDVTASGNPIPSTNHTPVLSYAIAAAGGTLSADGTRGTLTLDGIFDPALQFAAAPSTDSSLETVADFAAKFARRFGDLTPNAAVSFQDETGALRTVTLNLATARMVDGKAVFDVEFTGVPFVGSLTLPLLFVDQATPELQSPEETRLQMEATVFDSAPGKFDGLAKVLFTSDEVVALQKTVTIRNNSTETVYPFLRTVNDGLFQSNASWAYDSIDPMKQEYRAYVGYRDATDGNYYFGLEPGKSITINVPLVFWDSVRIFISKDKSFFTNQLAAGDDIANNPYAYFAYERRVDGKVGPATQRYIATDPKMVSGDNGLNPGDTPVVMYYHGKESLGPVVEAPVQLLEFTIRDPIQAKLNPNLPNPATNSNYLGPLFNYDLSFVDSLMFPVALQATDIPMGSGQAYGWVGAAQSVAEFQKALADFTSDNPALNGLGSYFGGLGWNKFYVPNEGDMGINLPSTKNIFELSPYALSLSVFKTGTNSTTEHFKTVGGGLKYQIDTFGTGSIKKGETRITGVNKDAIAKLAPGMITNNLPQFLPGTNIVALGTDWIELNQPAQVDWKTGDSITFIGSRFENFTATPSGKTLTLDDRTILSSLKPGMLVESASGVTPPTRILSVNPTLGTVTLDTDVSGLNRAFAFSGAVSDYASDRLFGLWYGWADYYRSLIQSKSPAVGAFPTTATIAEGTRTLTFPGGTDLSNLYPGMVVTGPGLYTDPADPTTTTTISRIDGNTIYLSKVAKPGGGSGNYTFDLPRAIQRSAEVVPLAFDFSGLSVADKAQADAFAQTVYTVMDTWGTIPASKDPLNTHSYSNQLLSNIIGGNVTQILYLGTEKTPIWEELTAEFRDASKSAERGVPDFKLPQFDEASGLWYTDPTQTITGAKVDGKPATYNLYTLDPYAWFVHKKLGVSGYAFSLDDDSADVGAENSRSLTITIGGIQKLPNPAEWSFGAPYGPVKGNGTATVIGAGFDQATNPDRIVGLPADLLKQLGNPNPGEGKLGALVIGPGIAPGTRVQQLVGTDTIWLTKRLDAGSLGTQPADYVFFGPTHFTGTTSAATPNRISNVDADVMGVLKNITLNGTLLPGSLNIIGPGLAPNTQILNIDFVAGWIEVTPGAISTSLPAGAYRFKIT